MANRLIDYEDTEEQASEADPSEADSSEADPSEADPSEADPSEADSSEADSSEAEISDLESEYEEEGLPTESEDEYEEDSEGLPLEEPSDGGLGGDPLDTTWINEFKKKEMLYNDFYKESVKSIAVYLMYVNNENELEHLHRDRCFLEANGLLKREVIISFIKRYQLLFSINYKINSLLRYNIDLDPSEINDFLNDNITDLRFIKSEKYLNDIHYEDTIHMFQDLNALFFIFKEDTPKLNSTKRIALGSTKAKNKTKRNTNKKNLKIFKHLT